MTHPTQTLPTAAKLPGTPPIPGGLFDLQSLGYIEEEYLLSGVARSFVQVGARGADGRWSVEPGQEAAFVTRCIVRRPADARAASGVVVVEWNNVTSGLDVSPDWIVFHRHLIRCGHVWIGVTAQKAGVDGREGFEGLSLKALDAQRYGGLDHPGDAYAFDIFGQIAALLRAPAGRGILGGLDPRRLIAVGESQSAFFLVTFVNAIDPRAEIFDACLIHGRGAIGAPLQGPMLLRSSGPDAAEALRTHPGERIRPDTLMPVIVLQSETDVILLGGAKAAQADGDRLRIWEIAGAAHADTYILTAGPRDDGLRSGRELADLLGPTTDLPYGPATSPINSGPQQHYVAQAALEALDRWAAGGPAPPKAARLVPTADGDGLVLDELGIAVGGVRTPWVEVPSSILSGLGQSGAAFAALFGTTRSLDEATLRRLYPGGEADYLARFRTALDRAIDEGFLLADDRDEILAVAAASFRELG